MKRSRLQQMSLEVMVGAFMMMVLLALGFFTIILSQDNVFRRTYTVPVVFDYVTGLVKGDKVYVHGVNVGRVKNLSIQPDGVHAELALDYEVKLRQDYRIAVMPSSVLGGKYVDIQEGSADAALLPPGTRIEGRGPVDFLKELTEGIQAVRGSLEKGGVLGNLEDAMANIKDITQKLRDGEGTVGKLLVEDALYTDLRTVSTNLAAISERLAQGEGTLGRLMSRDDQLYRDLSEAVAALKDVATTISNGEGTLGKLAKDDGLYKQIDGLLVEVRAVVDDLRETTPVVSFTSIFFGAF